MKNILPLLFGAALLPLVANAQSYSNVVGYITHTINGIGTNAPAPNYADTYLSASLIEPAAFAGQSDASPSGGKTITFATAVPTGLDGAYVLEITSSGWWSTLVSSTASSITVLDDFPAGLPANVQVSVRKHTTLHSLLGDNAPGLVTYNGVDPSDEVHLLNPDQVPQSVTQYAYISGPDLGDPAYPNGAWWDLAGGAAANNVIIEPGTAIRLKRIGATDLTFVSVGEVKTSPTEVDLYTDFNWVGTHIANGTTLNGMNFQNQLFQYDGVNPNYDELQILTAVIVKPGQDPNQYVLPFAAADLPPLTMFDLLNSVDGGATPMPEGTGVVIRRIGNAAGTITTPGSTVAP